MGAFLQLSGQCFASYRGKLMGEVTVVVVVVVVVLLVRSSSSVVVASCGGITPGSFALRDRGSVLLVLDFIRRPASRKTHGAMRQGIPITLRRCLSTQCLTSLATRDSQADVDSF